MTVECDRCGTVRESLHYVTNYLMVEGYPRNIPPGQALHVRLCSGCHCDILGRARDVCFFPDHPGFAGLRCGDPEHVVSSVLES